MCRRKGIRRVLSVSGRNPGNHCRYFEGRELFSYIAISIYSSYTFRNRYSVIGKKFQRRIFSFQFWEDVLPVFYIYLEAFIDLACILFSKEYTGDRYVRNSFYTVYNFQLAGEKFPDFCRVFSVVGKNETSISAGEFTI